jgi:hypothetical protein
LREINLTISLTLPALRIVFRNRGISSSIASFEAISTKDALDRVANSDLRVMYVYLIELDDLSRIAAAWLGGISSDSQKTKRSAERLTSE